ncbi:MAG: SDR family oxidoreductase [Nanoarchaeota archaeon]
MDFNNKLVLITGASSGIGAATAKEFAKHNARVLLLARRIEELRKVAEEIQREGGYAKYYPVNIADYRSVEKTANKIKKEVGIPDIIFNNGGSGIWKYIDEETSEDISKLMTLYFGAFFVTRVFLPDILKRNTGHIVNMSSHVPVLPFPGANGYIVAHAAMRGFTDALRSDLYNTDINVTLLSCAKFRSTFWANNPGSEERYPKVALILGVPPVEVVARIIVKSTYKKKKVVTIPSLLKLADLINFICPPLMRWLLYHTGFTRKDLIVKNQKKPITP